MRGALPFSRLLRKASDGQEVGQTRLAFSVMIFHHWQPTSAGWGDLWPAPNFNQL